MQSKITRECSCSPERLELLVLATHEDAWIALVDPTELVLIFDAPLRPVFQAEEVRCARFHEPVLDVVHPESVAELVQRRPLSELTVFL